MSTRMMDVPVVTDRRRGAIGVDLDADHLAVAETDAAANGLNTWRMPLVIYGKFQYQAGARLSDAAASVLQYARHAGKPMVNERLDFRQKKAVSEVPYPDAVVIRLWHQGVIYPAAIGGGVHQVTAFCSLIGRLVLSHVWNQRDRGGAVWFGRQGVEAPVDGGLGGVALRDQGLDLPPESSS